MAARAPACAPPHRPLRVTSVVRVVNIDTRVYAHNAAIHISMILTSAQGGDNKQCLDEL